MWSMAGMDGQWLPVKQSSSLLLQFMWLPKNVNAVLLILSAPFCTRDAGLWFRWEHLGWVKGREYYNDMASW